MLTESLGVVGEIVGTFIQTDLNRAVGKPFLGPDENLLESRMLDSLGIQKLLAFLEHNFRIEISDEEVLPENFETVAAISAFVSRKMNDVGI